VFRNYAGEDTGAGEEIDATMQLDGYFMIWKVAHEPARDPILLHDK